MTGGRGEGRAGLLGRAAARYGGGGGPPLGGRGGTLRLEPRRQPQAGGASSCQRIATSSLPPINTCESRLPRMANYWVSGSQLNLRSATSSPPAPQAATISRSRHENPSPVV